MITRRPVRPAAPVPGPRRRSGARPAHCALVIVLLSSVTAPLRARSRPSTVAPVVTVIDVSAKMLPLNVVVVPSVAELPTCQKTLQDWAPLMRLTVLAEAVVSVRRDLEDEDGVRVALGVEGQRAGELERDDVEQ